MSINHERRIRDLETLTSDLSAQLSDAGGKIAALQRENAALAERVLAAEAALDGLSGSAPAEEPRRGPGRPRKNPEQPQA